MVSEYRASHPSREVPRQNRGALEKYYVAVAEALSADPRAFASRRGAQAANAAATLATRFLDLTAEDLRVTLLLVKQPLTKAPLTAAASR